MKMKLSVMFCFLLITSFFGGNIRTAQSQSEKVCNVPDIKEEGTGVVYCLGLGSSTCVVPCQPVFTPDPGN